MNPRIFLLALGTFALGTDAFVMAGVLPSIAGDLGVSVDLTGQLVTVFSLTYGLGAPFLAGIFAAVPRRRLLMTALFVFGIANFLSALSPNFTVLLLTRILAASCASIYSPTAYNVAVQLAPPEKRGRALSTVIAGLTISTVIGVPLGTWTGHFLGWRMTFGLVVLLALVAVTLLQLLGLPELPAPPAIKLVSRFAPLRQPRLLLALSITFVWTIGGFIVYTYLAPLFQHQSGIGDVGGLLLIYGLGAVVGSWFGGYSVDRFGAERPLLVGLAILILLLASVPLTFSFIPSAIPVLFIWAATGWMLFPVQQSRLLAMAPEHANVSLALNNSALYLGIAAGSSVGGLIIGSGLIEALGPVGSGFELLALGLLLLSLRWVPVPAKRGSDVPSFASVERSDR